MRINFPKEETPLQTAFLLIVSYAPDEYYNVAIPSMETNCAPSEVLLKEVLEKYSDAWQKLSDR